MMFQKKRPLVKINAEVRWVVAHDPRSGVYTGICAPLNLNAMGDTFSEFQKCANETLTLLFQDLFEEGELDQFLRERGWSMVGKAPSGGRAPRFDVPFEIDRTDSARLLTLA